jgi:hypothetical protein
MARRDDRGYREYLRKEQRRQPGCPARELCREPRGQDTRCVHCTPRVSGDIVSAVLASMSRDTDDQQLERLRICLLERL